jgi:hypothetical protein
VIFFGNVRKLLEIIGKYCWSARPRISSFRFLKGEFFLKFSEIIGKYCRGARRQISSDRFLKGDFFSEIFGNYWKLSENIVGVRDDKSLQTGS